MIFEVCDPRHYVMFAKTCRSVHVIECTGTCFAGASTENRYKQYIPEDMHRVIFGFALLWFCQQSWIDWFVHILPACSTEKNRMAVTKTWMICVKSTGTNRKQQKRQSLTVCIFRRLHPISYTLQGLFVKRFHHLGMLVQGSISWEINAIFCVAGCRDVHLSRRSVSCFSITFDGWWDKIIILDQSNKIYKFSQLKLNRMEQPFFYKCCSNGFERHSLNGFLWPL